MSAPAYRFTDAEDIVLGRLAGIYQAGEVGGRDLLWLIVGQRLVRRAVWWVGRFVPSVWVDDVAQETWLAFEGLVAAWRPAVAVLTGFARYLFGLLPWRVVTACRRLAGERWQSPVGSWHAVADEEGAIIRAVDMGAAARGLSPGDRDIVVLCVVRGMEWAEIGRAVGLSAGAARTRYRSIVRALMGNTERTGTDAQARD
ncbi:MAG: sigma-70 family RNA polymerase sigma factor [Thermomicrobiales bacterium]